MTGRSAKPGRPGRAVLDLPGVTVAGRLGTAGTPAPPGGAAGHGDGGGVGDAAVGDGRAGHGRRDPEAHTARIGSDVDEDVRKALAYLLRSANAKPQTEAELRDKLRRREVVAEVADEAVAHARRLGAIDDEALAHAWVAERGIGRGFGRTRLREELTRRQVPDHLVEDALSALDDRDDLAAATEIARERRRQLPDGLPPEAAARRLAAYLTRRGHPPGLAQRVAVEVSGLRDSWD